MLSCTFLDKARLACLVASDRMYTLLLLIAFMRIRSPNNAPPVLRLDGSTDIIASVLSLTSIKKRLTNSSTREDLPDPPVPVIPRTGA
ncbi:hypothetical protein D3C87_1705890 [compost metagenome]